MSVLYRYKAVDASGETRRGEVRAASEHDAFRRVRAMDLTPLDVARAGEKRASARGVTQSDIASLARELSVLLEARIPIGRGLMAIAEHESKPAVRAMVRDVAAQIEAGSPLTEALGKHRAAFGDVFIQTVRASETSGTLQEAMGHLADMLERQIETRRQFTRALSYPAIVLSIVMLALGVIVIFVVPRFAETFQGQGMELPLATQIVRAVGESVRAYWWIYGMGLASALLCASAAWKSEPGRIAYERGFLRTPYVKSVLGAVTAARFARVMGLSLGAGVDLVEAVEMSGRATGRPLFIAESRRMAERVRAGEAVGDVVHESQILPGFARRMIAAGKDSKELSRACGIVARYYDREADHLTKNVGTIIEPLLTVAMAAIVLVIALSVFLPMWEMVGMTK